MLNTRDILETINMIENEDLDVRTITMGISLIDCIDPDINKATNKVYDKICRYAQNLVKTGEDISKEYGIPIVNKRISVTPIAMISGACQSFGLNDKAYNSPIKFAKILDKAAKEVGVNFIGGYSALVQKGFSNGDKELILSIPEALATTDFVCSSVNIGSTKAGINMDAVKMMGKAIKDAAILTKDRECIGAAKLVVFCNAPEDNPFMAGAFHGVGEPDRVINVGVSGPGVVRAALSKLSDTDDISKVAELIKRTAFKITRMGQLVAQEASKRLDTPFGIVDLSLAPTPAVGDSVAYILEEMGLEQCGAHGTTATLALLNDAVKKGGVMASSHVGGLSGAFIPVSEDAGMIAAARSGALSLTKLEAMTSVCSVGLDMIIVPGDVSNEILSGIIADEAAIGMVNSKTTAVRLIPAIGKKAGEELNFGGLLGGGPIMEVNTKSPAKFINRGGRIPAPMQSLKN
ncbi:MAG: PFL family protein [Clostridia bacterium]|nr:PFL family protein [Clostridia bacterium]